VLVALLALAGTVGGCEGGSDRTDDEAANDAILAELPRYPEAVVHDKSVNPYYSDSGGAPRGHTTNVNYRVPPGTNPVAVVRFYSSRLRPEWRCRSEREDVFALLHCRRGRAILSVNTDNLGATSPRYELVVDHDDRTG
jgi:hypothetical protein